MIYMHLHGADSVLGGGDNNNILNGGGYSMRNAAGCTASQVLALPDWLLLLLLE